MFKTEGVHSPAPSSGMNAPPLIASMHKIGFHKDRIQSYLKGEQIYPVTLELDLTSRCNRNCPDCPSTRVSHNHHLTIDFIHKLFSHLRGQTKGLLLTGGEPTLSPLLPEALQSARQNGFEEIAVVTNGSFLDTPSVEASLIRHASTIRLSLYDWENSVCSSFDATLRKIEGLRARIDRSGSRLQIGISALTSESRREKLKMLTEKVQSAGAHWIYFHPLCTKWRMGRPTPERQDGVMEKMREIQSLSTSGIGIFFSRERYEKFPLEFKRYHAADFLLVIGADGKNYLGPEVKYHPRFAASDPLEAGVEDFLWDKTRRDFIRSHRSDNYPAIQSRHRGILYNHLIQQLQDQAHSETGSPEPGSSGDFYFPHIL
jgi:MoaA/NifB/PqqE/SkfB family radical SAM enzyme